MKLNRSSGDFISGAQNIAPCAENNAMCSINKMLTLKIQSTSAGAATNCSALGDQENKMTEQQ